MVAALPGRIRQMDQVQPTFRVIGPYYYLTNVMRSGPGETFLAVARWFDGVLPVHGQAVLIFGATRHARIQAFRYGSKTYDPRSWDGAGRRFSPAGSRAVPTPGFRRCGGRLAGAVESRSGLGRAGGSGYRTQRLLRALDAAAGARSFRRRKGHQGHPGVHSRRTQLGRSG